MVKLIYSLNKTDKDLESHQSYQYKILCENKAGIGESLPSNVTTPQSVPEQMYEAEWVSKDRNSITLMWRAPGKENGMISKIVPVLQ